MIDSPLDVALRTAGEVVGAGRSVAFEPLPALLPSEAADRDQAAAELAGLFSRVHAAGLAGASEVTLPVALLGAPVVRDLAATAGLLGVALALAGPAAEVDELAAELPSVRVVVPAADPDAERRCRAHAAGRVRLVQRGGPALRSGNLRSRNRADLAFVRCLNVLFAAPGRPAFATTDRRLIAVAGERAAWYERTPESWEHVMPHGVRVEDQRRLVAAGQQLRVAIPAGPGGLPAVLGAAVRRLAAGVLR